MQNNEGKGKRRKILQKKNYKWKTKFTMGNWFYLYIYHNLAPVVSKSEPAGKHFRNTYAGVRATDIYNSMAWSGA